MSIKALHFSPTGATKKTALIVAEALSANQPVREFDLAGPHLPEIPLAAGDLAVIAMPTFGGRLPSVAATRLAAIAGQGVPAILILCYGNRAYDDSLLELKDLATASGFKPIAALAAVTEHSIFRQFGPGRPDAADKKELQSFCAKIKTRLAVSGPATPDSHFIVPGKHPYARFGGFPAKPKANSQCTKCGVCATHCPTGAISPQQPELTGPGCITCMACISACPNQARSINKVLLAAVGLALKKACSSRKLPELFM